MTTILLKDCRNKTLSVEIRLHCDSNSQWVADSTLEVISGLLRMDKAVYKTCKGFVVVATYEPQQCEESELVKIFT